MLTQMKSLSVHTGAALPGAAVDADGSAGTGTAETSQGVSCCMALLALARP